MRRCGGVLGLVLAKLAASQLLARRTCIGLLKGIGGDIK